MHPSVTRPFLSCWHHLVIQLNDQITSGPKYDIHFRISYFLSHCRMFKLLIVDKIAGLPKNDLPYAYNNKPFSVIFQLTPNQIWYGYSMIIAV